MPFTTEQFLNVFQQYNEMWPGTVVVFYLLSLMTVLLVYQQKKMAIDVALIFLAGSKIAPKAYATG